MATSSHAGDAAGMWRSALLFLVSWIIPLHLDCVLFLYLDGHSVLPNLPPASLPPQPETPNSAIWNARCCHRSLMLSV
jgi:hypothetical protein